MNYVLIVKQTPVEATRLQAQLPPNGDTKWHAVYCGQPVLGLNHRGKRPNIIVKDYVELTEKDTWWTAAVLRPIADRDAVWIG